MTTNVKPVALIILDGWGVSQKTEANALALARLPFYNSLLRTCPYTMLSASGEDTGLPGMTQGGREAEALGWWRKVRHRHGTFLRDGPRPAVGPRCQSLYGYRRRNWRASKVGRRGRDGELCGERDRRIRGPRRHRGPARPSDREH